MQEIGLIKRWEDSFPPILFAVLLFHLNVWHPLWTWLNYVKHWFLLLYLKEEMKY